MRDEIAYLGERLGLIVERLAGREALQLVEQVRKLAWQRRDDHPEAVVEIRRLVEGMDFDQMRIVIRAFTIFLDLANLAEDRERIRVLRERECNSPEIPRDQSIAAALAELKRRGAAEPELLQLLDSLQIELVLTAHPTEAKRRSVRSKLRKVRKLLDALDLDQSLVERKRSEALLDAELAKLWQTDFIRPWRPSVIQEVQRGLAVKSALWDVVPDVLRDVRSYVTEAFHDQTAMVKSCLRFGSWIGGDRDGHPGVTPEITEQAIVWLRETAIQQQLEACSALFESLSLSRRQLDFGPEMNSGIYAACKHWPHLKELLASIPPNEMCRRWLEVIRWRLRQTERVTLREPRVEGAYASSGELVRDAFALLDAVSKSPAAKLLCAEVQAWIDRIEAFGFHLANLDVRQDARKYRRVIDDLLTATGLANAPSEMSEAMIQQLLIETMDRRLTFKSPECLDETCEDVTHSAGM